MSLRFLITLSISFESVAVLFARPKSSGWIGCVLSGFIAGLLLAPAPLLAAEAVRSATHTLGDGKVSPSGLESISQSDLTSSAISLQTPAQKNSYIQILEKSQIQVDGLKPNLCYQNAREVLKKLQKEGIDIEKETEVLFIAFFRHRTYNGTYNFHVVTKLRDYIIDGNLFDDQGNLQIIPFDEYFQNQPYHQVTELRIIPGNEYLTEDKHYGYYWAGMFDLHDSIILPEVNEAQDRYPAISLNDYLHQK